MFVSFVFSKTFLYCCLVIRTSTTKKILLPEKHRWYLWKHVRLYITAIEFSPLSGTFWLIIIPWIKKPCWPRSLLWHEDSKEEEHPMEWLTGGTCKEWRCYWYKQIASRVNCISPGATVTATTAVSCVCPAPPPASAPEVPRARLWLPIRDRSKERTF